MNSNLGSTRSLVLVTGATGFVGRALCQRLLESGFKVRAALRHAERANGLGPAVEPCVVGEIGAHTLWKDALREVAVVVHLASGAAARGVSLRDRYREVNVAGTQSLAAAAATSGVRRLVFMSTIKVNGEQTPEHRPFTELDTPRPEDAYAQSKWEAEIRLQEQFSTSGLSVTILRPPIVYGPGVKGNLLVLMKALHRGIPLPFASVHNSRSLICIDNLIDATLVCMNSPVAAGKTYLVSDGEDLSTPDLIRALAAGLGVPERLFPCPVALLKFAASLIGKGGEIARLTGSLRVDNSRIRDELGWKPRVFPAAGLAQMAQGHLKAVNSNQVIQ